MVDNNSTNNDIKPKKMIDVDGIRQSVTHIADLEDELYTISLRHAEAVHDEHEQYEAVWVKLDNMRTKAVKALRELVQ